MDSYNRNNEEYMLQLRLDFIGLLEGKYAAFAERYILLRLFDAQTFTLQICYEAAVAPGNVVNI